MPNGQSSGDWAMKLILAFVGSLLTVVVILVCGTLQSYGVRISELEKATVRLETRMESFE